ncbi:acyl-CoA dehydrogenase family protein [Gordonia sp. zg691]|uniref:acyl-CoA dehydrogenase family protein n=1 Tax=Gordonia jinghuaiqii TaxID=2758710 RepID=UPI0016625B80|nr:acyl-CoA dehydrogenase family protein [Gordonia jinghuaiqii]MBD0862598.1 acyl-CoA dehydrogenase family protein [Gordonia jinghuaiqii]
MAQSRSIAPLALFGVDTLVDPDEPAIRGTVRQFVGDRIAPHISDWFESGEIPARELARDLGGLGLLGMHLEGYGCAGTSATAYGLACMELEAADSGLRSLVSVQGSLAMYAIWKHGSDPRFETNAARVAHRAELVAVLKERLMADEASAGEEKLSARGVPAGQVGTVETGFARGSSGPRPDRRHAATSLTTGGPPDSLLAQ